MRNRHSSTFDSGRRTLARTLPTYQYAIGGLWNLLVEFNVIHHFKSESKVAEETVDTE